MSDGFPPRGEQDGAADAEPVRTSAPVKAVAVGVRAALLAGVAGLMARRPARRRADVTGALTEARFRALFEASPVGIGLSDERGVFVAVNPAMCRLFGRPAEELLGRSAAPFHHPDDRHVHAASAQLITAAEDGVGRVQKRYVRPDGTVRTAWLTLTHITGPDGRPWTLAHVQDVTERVAAEQALRESQETVLAVARLVRRIRSGVDVRGTILEAVRALGGASSAHLVEYEDACGSPGARTGEGPAAASSLVVTASVGVDMTGMRTPIDATSVYVEVVRSGRPLFLADPAADPLFAGDLLAASGARSVLVHPVQSGDATLGVLVVAWDERIDSVSDQRAATVDLLADETALALDNEALLRRLERTAATDALTGLPNRRSWEADLPALIASARRTGAPLSIAVADLDHFKVYNDTFGHQAGDDLLRRFAAVCTEVLREPDVVARWGGEEFVIALPACPEAHAQRVLDRLRAAVPEGQTCSIGLAVWDGVESPDALLARADAALYRAKALGRDTVASAAVGSNPGPSILTSSSDS